MSKVLRPGVLLVSILLAACGGPGPTGGPGSTGGPGATSATGGQTGGPGASSGTAPVTNASIRLVNAWAETDKLGPSVKLRVAGADTEVVLLSATPGQVTDFAAVPAAEFGDGPAGVEAVVEGTDAGVRLDFADGNRVTVIVHGEVPSGGGPPVMRVEQQWEQGEQAIGVPWPTPGVADVGVIAVFPGPLLALETNIFVHLRTEAGECLTDATFNEPQDGGFGGTGAHYYLLPGSGPLTIHLGTKGGSGCAPIEPDIGTAEIDTSTGKRFALVVWGMPDDLDVITLDMGTP